MNQELEASALFENKKAGILMASRHKNPGRFPNDKFPKTLYKIVSVKSTPAKKLPDTN